MSYFFFFFFCIMEETQIYFDNKKFMFGVEFAKRKERKS